MNYAPYVSIPRKDERHVRRNFCLVSFQCEKPKEICVRIVRSSFTFRPNSKNERYMLLKFSIVYEIS